MKKLLSIFGMLLLLINVVAAAVVITPDNPDTNDQLTCDVSDSAAVYNYYWYVDGNRVKLETARSSTLAASETSGSDEVICRAYRPSTPFTPESYVGSDTVTIKGSIFAEPGLIIMYPWSPEDSGEGYPDDGYGEAYNPPEGYPDDGNIDVYVQPEYPDDGDIDVYVHPKQCSDGIDNDGDGFVDMNDPGCSSPQDDDEHNDIHNPACSDGVDNDNDGLIDMRDPGCDSPQDNDESNPTEDEEPSEGQARNLNLDMVYATVEDGNLVIDYILDNDGTMSVKEVELSVNVPDLGMNHFENLGKISVGKKVYGKITMKLPVGAEGTHLVLVEAIGLGAHDSEQRTFTVENTMDENAPNIGVVVFEPDVQVQHKGFFARVIEWFLSLFRALFSYF